MNLHACRCALAAALLLPPQLAGAAPVERMGEAQMRSLLARKEPCCVIDARSAGEREKLGVAHTLVYRKGMKINPTGVVVVIADTDARAQEVGEELAKTSAAKQVVAVKGGARAWLAALEPAARGKRGALSFIIPSNTCEQGPALQTLPLERK